MGIHINFRQKYVAGIFLSLASTTIPPQQPSKIRFLSARTRFLLTNLFYYLNQTEVHADTCCSVRIPAPVHLFAYRTHAHGLGRVISGYKLSKKVGFFFLLIDQTFSASQLVASG